jgi:hypothetical protein
VYDCVNQSVWQSWFVSVDTATGAAILKNVGSGKCLDSSGNNNPGGTPWIWDCDPNNSNINQKWRMTGGWWRPYWQTLAAFGGATTNAYTLLAANGSNNTALDSGGNYANGSKMTLASAVDNNRDNQMMILPTGTNTYKIAFAGNTNKCLDHPLSSADGTVMQVWDCNGGTNQNWMFSTAQNGSIQIQNQWSGKCLDDNNADATDNGVQVITATCGNNNSANPNWNQVWQLTTYN